MAKTLRKRKIAKAYGLKFESRKLPSALKLIVIKRKIAGFLVVVEFYKNNGTSIENEIKFYRCVDKLRPKTFKSRIGGNY